jgi:hypothetical protein
MPIGFYTKTYRDLIESRLNTIKVEKAKIEKTVGADFLAGRSVAGQKSDYDRLSAEEKLLVDIRASVEREYGRGSRYDVGMNKEW